MALRDAYILKEDWATGREVPMEDELPAEDPASVDQDAAQVGADEIMLALAPQELNLVLDALGTFVGEAGNDQAMRVMDKIRSQAKGQ